MRYPRVARFRSGGAELQVSLSKITVSNVFVVRLLSEAALLNENGEQSAFAVTEVLSPKVKYTKWLSWLITRRGWEVN